MVGKVTFEEDGITKTAVLHENMTWTCEEDPETAEALGYVYNERDWPTGPSRGSPGHAALNHLAEWKKGTVWFEPKEPDPPDVVY